MNHRGSTFLCGCAAFYDLIFFAKELDELIEKNTENSSFFMMSNTDWNKYEFDGAWSAISMATIRPSGGNRTVVAISPRGAFWEVDPAALNEVSGEINGVQNSLRALAAIDNAIYACGMGRTVLSRNGPGDWDNIGPNLKENNNTMQVVGFEDIDGFSGNDIYTVGWNGEIWHFNGSIWRRMDSPVSANLNAVCCASNGTVYIVGDEGVMLHGRDDTWDVIETGRFENLMDVAFYGGVIYMVTDFEILKVNDDLSIVPEDKFFSSEDPPGTCLHLLIADDGLVSIGPKDLFRLHGNVWERLA